VRVSADPDALLDALERAQRDSAPDDLRRI
jgi:hypothetical protein